MLVFFSPRPLATRDFELLRSARKYHIFCLNFSILFYLEEMVLIKSVFTVVIFIKLVDILMVSTLSNGTWNIAIKKKIVLHSKVMRTKKTIA